MFILQNRQSWGSLGSPRGPGSPGAPRGTPEAINKSPGVVFHAEFDFQVKTSQYMVKMIRNIIFILNLKDPRTRNGNNHSSLALLLSGSLCPFFSSRKICAPAIQDHAFSREIRAPAIQDQPFPPEIRSQRVLRVPPHTS